MNKIETPAELVLAVKQYFELAEKIHEFFGYKEDWVSIPMKEQLECYWMIVGGDEKGAGGTVVCSKKPFTKKSLTEGKSIYSDTIYTQRFLPRWVYRTQSHTLTCVDTHTDGNKFLYIFDNEKECKDEELKTAYAVAWPN